MTAGEAFYTKQGGTYAIKLVGDIRYSMGCSLDEFLEQLFAQGDYDDILIDLTEVNSIDSTSLGLMAKVANFMRQRFGRKATLVSTNADINQTLDSIGFSEVFNICADRAVGSEGLERLSVAELNKTELAKTLFEAHRALSELNEKNRETFKGVLEALKGKVADH